MFTPSAPETHVPNLKKRPSKNASKSGAKYTQKHRLPDPRAMPQEKTERKRKRATISCALNPLNCNAINLMGELAKEAQLQ